MSDAIKLISLVKAKPGFTREEFGRYWLENHAPLTAKFENMKGYRINLVTDAYQETDGPLPFDGTAELWWDSLEEMQEDFASEAGHAALVDADRFIEKIHIYMKEHIIK